MHPKDTPSSFARLLMIMATALLAGVYGTAQAAVTSYVATLNGANESPPNASAGTGSSQVDIDPVANTMRVRIVFTNLTGTTTASHIHAPTPTAGTGLAGVATTTPYFAGFPIGVTSGTYDNTLDMTQTSSYSSTFLTNSGGTTALAEAALFADIAAGTAYVNVHSTVYAGGEIRGFLIPALTPTRETTWGRVKSLYTSWLEDPAPDFEVALGPGLSLACAPTPACCAMGCCAEQATVAVAAK